MKPIISIITEGAAEASLRKKILEYGLKLLEKGDEYDKRSNVKINS